MTYSSGAGSPGYGAAVAGALPEKHHGVPGGFRGRRGHGETRCDSANSGLALALAGGASNDGAAWIPAADARWNSGDALNVVFCTI